GGRHRAAHRILTDGPGEHRERRVCLGGRARADRRRRGGESDSSPVRRGAGGCTVSQFQQRADLLRRLAPPVLAQGRHRADLPVGAGAGRGPERYCPTLTATATRVIRSRATAAASRPAYTPARSVFPTSTPTSYA